MFLCLVLPGVSVAGFLYFWFSWTYGSGSDGYLQTGITAAAFLAFVVACSWFAGALVAAKSGEEGRKSRTIKSAALFFLTQIFLVPALGWATCASFIAIS